MEEVKQNKMAVEPLKKLFWKMGLPMIISLVLQALYNVVDSIFVANMEGTGVLANEALTIAFPVQILIIAVGVGTGVGLNALLSKSLGEKNKEKVDQVAGNGVFLAVAIYIVFLIFGLFCSEWFIGLFTDNSEVLKMGTSYLRICTCLCLGTTGYTIYERFLQATGKGFYSMISQVSGALINVVLDYIFIFPLDMGVAGAAWATVIGQFISMFLAMAFHYILNKEIGNHPKYIRPRFDIIKGIYKIGASAALMQGLLSVMMAGVNAILGTASVDSGILVGSFGIYYKIQQVALFSAFGLSNTMITILSFNYGMRSKERSKDCIKYGIIDTLITTLIMTVMFELVAKPLSMLFALSGGSSAVLVDVCARATRIAAIGYAFMGFTVAVQGVLQALGYAGKPLILSLLRLVVFVFPTCYLFTLSPDVLDIVWWTFPIAEALTCVFAYIFLKQAESKKINALESSSHKKSDHLIITVSREHGTNGKRIGKLVAQRLGLKFYDKELSMLEAQHRGLDKQYADNHKEQDMYSLYLSLDAKKDSVIAQSEIITALAEKESFVIVGRAADYVLRDHDNVIRIFLYAPMKYKIKNIMQIYGDSASEAERRINLSDKARESYYELVSNRKWGDKGNYNLCLDCSVGNEEVVDTICDYISKIQKRSN
ncbi:MAG: MATE family efflux transporter [Clostridia bacterium]|nr:MATE family efflux transporter [Clostridia bacterium]